MDVHKETFSLCCYTDENEQSECCQKVEGNYSKVLNYLETGDFKRFSSAGEYASYLGLTPGEDSSGADQNRLGITKAGNVHLRSLLVESAQSYTRGQIGYKSKALKASQAGNPADVIAYADKGNTAQSA
ncbi:MAG: IS110 family transposase [Oscillospiraceae bacterium]|nr:IS110 family transposase [Oscillospiraceae bacterium]